MACGAKTIPIKNYQQNNHLPVCIHGTARPLNYPHRDIATTTPAAFVPPPVSG
jgi:hypothetical protein